MTFSPTFELLSITSISATVRQSRSLRSAILILTCLCPSAGAQESSPAVGVVKAKPAVTQETPEEREEGKQPSAVDDLREYFSKAGVEFLGGARFAVSPPVLANKTVAPARTQEQLKELAGKFGWERFARNDLRAPVLTKVTKLEEAEEQLGYILHTSYVVYAALDKFRDDDLLESTFGKSSGSKSGQNRDGAELRELTDEDLKPIGIVAQEDERFAHVSLRLLNLVQVQGTIRIRKYESESGMELYWMLDPRFASAANQGAKELTNGWQRISKDQRGNTVYGEQNDYLGLGGFISVYKTGQDEEQLLVESKLILHEPDEWFKKKTLLRGKLVLTAGEGAKKLRRKLRK